MKNQINHSSLISTKGRRLGAILIAVVWTSAIFLSSFSFEFVRKDSFGGTWDLKLGTSLFAQAPNYLWAKSEGGTGSDWANSVSTDANGNVYVAGYFESSSITFGTTTLTNAGSYDIFIAKLDVVTGINEITVPTLSGSFYPNPNSGKFTVQIPNGYESVNNEITIYNVLGENIHHSPPTFPTLAVTGQVAVTGQAFTIQHLLIFPPSPPAFTFTK